LATGRFLLWAAGKSQLIELGSHRPHNPSIKPRNAMARHFNRIARNPLHGSDSALGKSFVSALRTDFARHGASRIRKLRKQQPYDYLRLVALLLPQAFSASMAQASPPPSENEFARELEILRAFAAEYDKAGSARKD
jgi:hypothetical protein